jgi:hypothetical protein
MSFVALLVTAICGISIGCGTMKSWTALITTERTIARKLAIDGVPNSVRLTLLCTAARSLPRIRGRGSELDSHADQSSRPPYSLVLRIFYLSHKSKIGTKCTLRRFTRELFLWFNSEQA